jgi:hypothetical protein
MGDEAEACPRGGGGIECRHPACPGALHSHLVAQPARRQQRPDPAAPVDPTAVARAYRLERAKRHARARRDRERKNAHLRFWTALVLLTGMLALLSLTVWNEIERLFGI